MEDFKVKFTEESQLQVLVGFPQDCYMDKALPLFWWSCHTATASPNGSSVFSFHNAKDHRSSTLPFKFKVFINDSRSFYIIIILLSGAWISTVLWVSFFLLLLLPSVLFNHLAFIMVQSPSSSAMTAHFDNSPHRPNIPNNFPIHTDQILFYAHVHRFLFGVSGSVWNLTNVVGCTDQRFVHEKTAWNWLNYVSFMSEPHGNRKVQWVRGLNLIIARKENTGWNSMRIWKCWETKQQQKRLSQPLTLEHWKTYWRGSERKWGI